MDDLNEGPSTNAAPTIRPFFTLRTPLTKSSDSGIISALRPVRTPDFISKTASLDAAVVRQNHVHSEAISRWRWREPCQRFSPVMLKVEHNGFAPTQ